MAREKAEMMKSVRIDPAEEDVENIYNGMKIDVPKGGEKNEELEEEDEEKGDVLVRKAPRRKTKAQRNREARTLVKVCWLSVFTAFHHSRSCCIHRNAILRQLCARNYCVMPLSK